MRFPKLSPGSICLVLMSLLSVNARAQLSRVDQYAVTTFDADWDSLRTGIATTIIYDGGPNEGTFSLPLPFDFIFDGAVIDAGVPLKVSANGAMSFLNVSFPPQQLIGDPSFPATLAPFNGDLKQGSDVKAGVADTSGLYQVTGEAPHRVLTIEYRAFHLRGGGSGSGQVDTLTSMQVKLYESTGVIEFIYRDHGLDLPTKFPGRMCIGLNGQPLPEFKSNLYVKDTKVIPTADIRWTPGVASVDEKDHGSIILFPDPASSHVNVQLPTDLQLRQVEAIDPLGRVQPVGVSSSGRLDVSSLRSGRYLLRIKTNKGSFVREITIAR